MSDDSECPSAMLFTRMIEGKVDDIAEYRRVLRHMRTCRVCYTVLVYVTPEEGEDE